MANTIIAAKHIKPEAKADNPKPDDSKCFDCGKTATIGIYYHSRFEIDGKDVCRDFEYYVCCGCRSLNTYTRLFMHDSHLPSNQVIVTFETIRQCEGS